MAKRSPILGYNHNVRYRGVVFHVQTEDSGLLNPHLFTHLFHGGVIVSTRKLVYDAGANEEAIKALMQAQHKAVMKDLRKGAFDDKIDAYLSNVPGLEPRQGGNAAAVAARAKTEQAPPPAARANTEQAPPSASQIEVVNEDLSEPIELPVKARTGSDDRTRPVVMEPPPPQADDAPTLAGGSASAMAAAIEAANASADVATTQPIEQIPQPAEQPVKSRTSTARRVSRTAATPPSGAVVIGAPPPRVTPSSHESDPVIEIRLDEDASGRNRAPRDTAVEPMDDMADGVPRPGSDAMPAATTRTRSARPASHGAAALPAAKPPRPSLSPPIVTRPATGDRRRPGDSEAVEIYQPAPASVDPPPGERAERPGQYTISRKSGEAPIREKTGRIAAINPATIRDQTSIPAGLGRPRAASDREGGSKQPTTQRELGAQRAPHGVPREATPSRGATPPPAAQRAGTPQSARGGMTAPITNRGGAHPPQSGSGVVMTRPAVIVGAPPKPIGAQPSQRVRKAREDEGRGFGQGLISEKSLDEVILAYLSEDAEDK